MAQAQVVSASFVDNVMFVSLSFKKKSLTQILNLDFSQMMHLISIPFDL